MPNISAASEHDTRSIKKQRPMLSGQFVPVPMELLAFGRQLKLDALDVAVVTAVASFSPGWDVTYEDVAGRALCSVISVHRRLTALLRRELIGREEARFRGRVAGFRYDLTPLWDALGQVARGEANSSPDDLADVRSDAPDYPSDMQSEYLSDIPPIEQQPIESQRLAKTKSCSNSRDTRARRTHLLPVMTTSAARMAMGTVTVLPSRRICCGRTTARLKTPLDGDRGGDPVTSRSRYGSRPRLMTSTSSRTSSPGACAIPSRGSG